MVDDPNPEEREAPIDNAVIVRTAESTGATEDDLSDALAVLNAELLGRHSEFEAESEYVTVDGRRAYAVGDADWQQVTAGHDLSVTLERAVRDAHTEQARLLFEEAAESVSVESDAGIVVGVDTAEQMS